MIDVSEHDKITSFKGYDGVIIRMGYGFAHRDKKVDYHVKLAEKEGIPYGLYFYSYATQTKHAKLELNFIKKELKRYTPTLPIFVDMEDADTYKYNHGNPSKSILTEITRYLCEGIEKLGYYTGFYANSDWCLNKLDMKILSPYDLWLANWSSKKPPTPTSYKGVVGMWQYQGSPLDKSICYVDYVKLIKKFKLNNLTDKTPEKPTVKPTTIKKGDTVIVTTRYDYDGKKLDSWVTSAKFKVLENIKKRVVVTRNGEVIGAFKEEFVKKVL